MIGGRALWLGFQYGISKGNHTTAEQPGVQHPNVTLSVAEPGGLQIDLIFPVDDWPAFVRRVNDIDAGQSIAVVGADALKHLRVVAPPGHVNGAG